MKHLTFTYKDLKSYKKAKSEAESSKYKSQLIQLFCATTHKKSIRNILNKLNNDFPNAVIIGTTTAGEISHAKMYEDESVVSLSLFEHSKLKSSHTKNITAKAAKKLSKKICTKTTKAIIILSEGLVGEDYEGFIHSVKQKNANVIIAGGLAGDNFSLKKTYVFLGKKIYDTGAVGVSFSGKKLIAKNEYNLNWNAIGKEFTITKAEGNIVHEIDGTNAIEVMSHYLGSTLFDNNCSTLPSFPILYKEGNTVVTRTPMTIEKESIVFAGPVQEGLKIQFGFSNAPSIISGANAITNKLAKNPAEAIYIYSCIARKTLLGKKLESEFAPFEHLAPTAGFFTYGEFYSTDTDNALLNCTTTILVLSETDKITKNKFIQKQTSSLDNTTFNALTHFIKQTADELEQNRTLLKEYKDIVDLSSIVSKTDLKGIITYVNDSFCKVSKYTQEELLGKSHNIVRDPNMSDFIFKKLWFTILRGRVWRGLISNVAKDGSVYYLSSTIMPIFDDKNEITEFISIRQDVTKQIESKKRIQEKEQFIKAIFDNQDAMVISTTKKDGMQSVNKKLFELLNFKSFDEFKEKHKCICELFIKEKGYISLADNPEWIDDFADDTSKQHKVKIKVRDGSIHTFTLLIKKIDDAYILNLNDITQLEKAILKAHASERAKSIFLANMSHEIRTPLNGILGFTDVLTKRDLDKDTKHYIDIIHKSGQTLLHVVNDILDFSKIESGELSLYETESNLFKEMEATVSTFASLSKSKHINYYVYIDTAIPKLLKCDVQRIKQVVNNLISNAIKFTPYDGDVSLKIELKSIKNKKAKIHFSIKDSGIGIAKEKHKTVFTAFSQADESVSREFGGTGLGLAISAQYITMMNSQIKLKSKLKKGSEFYFDLLLNVADPEISIEQNTTNKLNIMVLSLEDSQEYTINKIVFTYLNAWKYTYTQINDIDDLRNDTHILIVCEKLFKQNECQKVLDKYKKLQLIYIEGTGEEVKYSHKRFHVVEQPMTGSALFNKIITTQSSHLKPEVHTKHTTKQFKGNVLVAEDNLTNQMLIAILLKERGAKFKIVENGQEAVDEALINSYDLIFMDINMPILDGISATKLLRSKGYHGTIVSLSANVIESDLLSFKEAGMDASLNKPIIPNDLDNTLQKYLILQDSEPILFDILDIQKISLKLKIANEDTIISLVHSFAKSLREIQKNISDQGLNEDILHNLKGMVGNLQFLHFQEFILKLEKNYMAQNQLEQDKSTQETLKHMELILQQIEKL